MRSSSEYSTTAPATIGSALPTTTSGDEPLLAHLHVRAFDHLDVIRRGIENRRYRQTLGRRRPLTMADRTQSSQAASLARLRPLISVASHS